MEQRRSIFRNSWKLEKMTAVQLFYLSTIVDAGLIYLRTKQKMTWAYNHFRPRVDSFFIATGQHGRWGLFLTLSFFDRDVEAHWLGSSGS